MSETTKIRIKLLKEMNDYILNVIGDEDVFDDWWTNGVPDSPSEEDYETIASDDNSWYDVVEVFARCCGFEGAAALDR